MKRRRPRHTKWLEAFPLALKQHLRGERRLDEFHCLGQRGENPTPRTTCRWPARTPGHLGGRRTTSVRRHAVRVAFYGGSSSLLLGCKMLLATRGVAGTPVPLSYRDTSRLLSIWTLGSPIILVQSMPLFSVAGDRYSRGCSSRPKRSATSSRPFGIHDDRPKILLAAVLRYCGRLAEENGLAERAVAGKRGAAQVGRRRRGRRWPLPVSFFRRRLAAVFRCAACQRMASGRRARRPERPHYPSPRRHAKPPRPKALKLSARCAGISQFPLNDRIPSLARRTQPAAPGRIGRRERAASARAQRIARGRLRSHIGAAHGRLTPPPTAARQQGLESPRRGDADLEIIGNSHGIPGRLGLA